MKSLYIFLIGLISLPFGGHAQDILVMPDEKASQVVLTDFADGKFYFRLPTDNEARSRTVPYLAIKAFYSANPTLLARVKSQSEKAYKLLITAEAAQKYPVATPQGSTAEAESAAAPALALGGALLLGVLPIKAGQVYYERILEVPGVSQDELYHRTMLWLANAYKSASDVIKYQSKEHATVLGKGIIREYFKGAFWGGVNTNVHHTILVSCKEGKVKVLLYGFTSSWVEGSLGITNKSLEEWAKDYPRKDIMARYLNSINLEVNSMLTELEVQLKMDPSAW